MIIVHADDCLMFYERKIVLNELVKSLKDDFKLTNKSNLEVFLDAQFKRINCNTLEISQPHLMQCMLNAFNL